MNDTLCIPIDTLSDVEQARRDVRQLAVIRGFGSADAESLVLAVSELGTNLVRYATRGELIVETIERDDHLLGGNSGIRVTSIDRGPGIADLEQAMGEGFSTSGGLGSGLSGIRRLMDTFEIQSDPGGTRVVASKWPTNRS